MNWIETAGRIVLVVGIGALASGIYGYPWVGVIVALVGVIIYWLYQMERVQTWLDRPDSSPPDIYGTWGTLLSHIHSNQRGQRVIQQRLQSNLEYLQSSFASMRDGVVMVDGEGAIKWFNKALEPLLGLRYPQDTGQLLTNLVRSPQFVEYFLAEDYSRPLQYTSQSENPVHLQIEITHFGEGERLLFVRDVSQAVRTEQIRRDFVANVSHELRTPLTVISGYLATLSSNPEAVPPRFEKPIEQMMQQAERMENLLKDLLWLSRIESEAREHKRELLDVGGLLQELKDELAGAHPGRTLELSLNTKEKIYGDYREIYSAISNLATNAFKYSPPETPVVVDWSSRGNYCRLAVTDQGIGIEASHIPRLTERFYRVDDSRNSATGGTGLGLAIVKHVAAAHDARLEIESAPGKGTTFALELPLGE